MNPKIEILRKISLIIVISILSFQELKATRQTPDRVKYNDLELSLGTGWAFPSPLQTYFYQNEIEYPFKMLNTGNYRGFVAYWEIKDEKLFLNEINVDRKKFEPKDFKVKSKNAKFNKGKEVFADWFSGVIECSHRKEDDFNYIMSYFFQIRNGVIVDIGMVEGELGNNDYFSKVKENKFWKMSWSYMGFYYLLTDDKVILNGEEGRLNLSRSKHSPLLSYYGESVVDFKYNWENPEKNGHPHSTWSVENETIYLTNLTLRHGNRFDTIYTHQIDLEEEFGKKFKANKVKANWINGVFLLKFGEILTETSGYEREIFQVNQYIYIRVKKGKIIEQHIVNEDFDFENLPSDINPKLKRIINEY